MIIDKDREDAKEILCTLKSIQAKKSCLTQDELNLACLQRKIDRAHYLADKIARIRQESADQARKEAAERVACAWREHGEDITLRMLRESILGDSAPVSTDSEKLAIAVKALEEINTLGTYSMFFGRTTTGERIDSTTIINIYGIKARDALKEIQG